MNRIYNYIFKDDPKRFLIFYTLVFVLLAFIIGIYCLSAISKINSSYKHITEIQNASGLINKADLYTNEFLKMKFNENYTSSAEVSKNQFDSTISKLESILNVQLKKSSLSNEEEQKVKLLLTEISNYKSAFYKIIELYSKVYSNDGFDNQMNNSLQSIERSELPVNMVPVVSLKKFQKDFLQKKDITFFQSFLDESSVFMTEVQAFDGSTVENPGVVDYNSLKNKLIEEINNYVYAFTKIVENEKEIGLTDNEGLKAKLAFSFKAIDNELNQLSQIFESKSLAMTNYVKISVAILFLIIIAAIILVLNYFIKKVYNPILVIQQTASQIAKGDLNINLEKIKSNKLLRYIVNTFGEMIHKLEQTLFQIEEIAKLNLNNKIELSSDNDMIGKSLVNVQKQLFKFTEDERLAKIEDEKRNWSTEGLAMFSNLLRGTGNLQTISQSIVSNLVKYVKANQGGLYIINTDEDNVKHIDLLACYAFERLKFVSQRIEIGEGLVGQCFLEKEVIYMNNVPDEYVRITSGLGDANPRCILIVPAKINDNIEAIIELASFNDFEKYQIDFIEKLADNIASTIWNIQVNEKTKKLLHESQLQTEEMKSKEEEMNQSIEELASTQEEMNRKEKFYQAKIEELSAIQEELNRKISVYHSRIEELSAINEELSRSDKLDKPKAKDLDSNPNSIDPVTNYQLT